MKKLFLLVLTFLLLICANLVGALETQVNPYPSGPHITSVSNSSTGSSWIPLIGTIQPQVNCLGNEFIISAFQIYSDYDFYYSFQDTNTPTAYGLWRTANGPMQNKAHLPSWGMHVCTTLTATGVYEDITVESK